MAERKCPGQDTQYWTVDDIFESPCSHCGYSLEFFRNDPHRCCPACGKYTLNPKLNLACADWCTATHDCLEPPEKQLVTEITEARHP